MFGYFCIGFTHIILKDKIFFDYTNLFSPNDYEKNDKTCSITKKMKKLFCVLGGKYRKLKNPEIWYVLEKTFKEEKSIDILKILSLIENI